MHAKGTINSNAANFVWSSVSGVSLAFLGGDCVTG